MTKNIDAQLVPVYREEYVCFQLLIALCCKKMKNEKVSPGLCYFIRS